MIQADHLNDEAYMRLALTLAGAAQGQTGCNPLVGCVIVKDGRIVGTGAHLKRGEAHAEIHALQMAGDHAAGSTVYVTLEPCSHYGKTPPCANRLIEAKVKRVVVACKDPNPQVAGRGIQLLQEHGIAVQVGLLEEEAHDLNEHFVTYITKNRPFITLKTASTLDGKIATYTGDSKWITGESSRAYVHTLRHRHQAIMVGIGTLLADDPSLTVRLPVPGVQPIRIVVDSKLRTPLHAKVVIDRSADTIILTTDRADPHKARQLEQQGVMVLACGDGDRVDLPLAMQTLAEYEIASILLEGGGKLNGAFLEQQLIDKIMMFFAPKIIGGHDAPGNMEWRGFGNMADAIELTRLHVQTLEQDVCISGYPVYERKGV